MRTESWRCSVMAWAAAVASPAWTAVKTRSWCIRPLSTDPGTRNPSRRTSAHERALGLAGDRAAHSVLLRQNPLRRQTHSGRECPVEHKVHHVLGDAICQGRLAHEWMSHARAHELLSHLVRPDAALVPS